MPIATSELRDAVSGIVDQLGTSRAASQLGVSREALARVVGQLEVRAGTLALLQNRLMDPETMAAVARGR